MLWIIRLEPRLIRAAAWTCGRGRDETLPQLELQPDPADPSKALCVDVLASEGYGEIIGGSQRVDSYDLLKSRIEEHGLPLEAFQWYLDLRKHGSVPHTPDSAWESSES